MMRLDYSAEQGLLTIDLDGMMAADEVKALMESIGTYIERAKRTNTQLRVLVDGSKAPVQQLASLAVIDTNRERSTFDAPIAIVVKSQLAKMQADRSSSKSNVRVFLDTQEALNWLGVPA
ncbi:MAG TPA: hypothetical protein VL918_06765 [Sphingobium sp.]|nr:hypothetical protein [Sphingobium sp.]